jgi:hypothetical protein
MADVEERLRTARVEADSKVRINNVARQGDKSRQYAPIIPCSTSFQLPIAFRGNPPTGQRRDANVNGREAERAVRDQREILRQVVQLEHPRERLRKPFKEVIHGVEHTVRVREHGCVCSAWTAVCTPQIDSYDTGNYGTLAGDRRNDYEGR